jgi:hypothetical protein
MITKSLTELLTAEQIQALTEGNLNFADIKIELPGSKPAKVDVFKQSKEALLSWLEKVTEGKTPEDSVPEFWLVLQYICQINYFDGSFDVEEQVPIFQNFLDCCEAEHTTVDMLTTLINTVPFHTAFLKKCTASSLVTRARKKAKPKETDVNHDDVPFI